MNVKIVGGNFMTAHENDVGLQKRESGTTDILVDLREMERNPKAISDLSRGNKQGSDPV